MLGRTALGVRRLVWAENCCRVCVRSACKHDLQKVWEAIVVVTKSNGKILQGACDREEMQSGGSFSVSQDDLTTPCEISARESRIRHLH